MAPNATIDRLREQLFGAREGFKIYAILDGASAERLPQVIAQHGVGSVCLLRGELDAELVQVAPYLVRLDPESPFTEWVLNQGWGKHWGIFVISEVDLRTLRQHFRALLTVYSADNVPLFFRYYDPRVLRVYLPTCNADELKAVFGPAERFLLEAEEGEGVLMFELKDGALVCR